MGTVHMVVAASAALLVGCADTPATQPAPATTVTVTPSALPASTAASRPSASTTVSSDPSWRDTIATVRSGVVRLQVATCTTSGSGSGLLVGDDLVLTAGHVVEGATSVTVGLDGGQISHGTVLGFDRSADLALVRTERSMSGHVFDLARRDPEIGDDVALVGYPFGDPELSARFGHIGDRGRSIKYTDDQGGTYEVEHLLLTDAATNPGNSGGPMITTDGTVVGVVSGKRFRTSSGQVAEGTGFAVSVASYADLIARWRSRGSGRTVDCGGTDEGGTDAPVAVSSVIRSGHPQAPIVAQSLVLHGTAINQGEYDVAFRLFTSAMRRRQGSANAWSQGLASSYWDRIEILDITGAGTGRLIAATRLRSIQDAIDGPDGQTCSDWRLDYTMVLVDGIWRIDKAKQPGAGPTAC